MKNLSSILGHSRITQKFLFFVAISSFVIAIDAQAQNVAINKDGSIPDASAMLDLSATDAGILIPRMTKTQKNAISSPATGLLVFQTDSLPGFYYHNGSIWVPMLSRPSQDVKFQHGDDDYIEADKNIFTTYGYIIFRGTSVVGVPTKITAICYSDGGESFSMRVRDITNAKTIVSNLSISNTSTALVDLGTISNLPTGEAIFAIQARKDNGDKGRLQALSIQY